MQATHKCLTEGRENFIHAVAAALHAARWKQQAVIKSLAGNVQRIERTFHGGIALAFINCILIIIKKRIDFLLLAKRTYRFHRIVIAIALLEVQRNAALGQRLLQQMQAFCNKGGLFGRHIMVLPLPGRGNIKGNNGSLVVAAGGMQRIVIIDA